MVDCVLLLVRNKADRIRLEEWLMSRQYHVVSPSLEDPFAPDFDLAIVDGPTLKRLRTRILARKLAAAPALLPFLLLAAQRKNARPVRYLGELVDDLIVKPIEEDELQARVANLLRLRRLSMTLKKEHDLVMKLSVTDDVSGFYNTRYLHRYLDRRFGGGKARERLSLVFFDLDNFKSVVDTHGHLLGTKALKEVAQAVAKTLDEDDRLVRYGGDEYIVLLPRQNKTEALGKVARMMQAITGTSFLEKEGLNIHLTASFGLATHPEDAADKRALLAAADRCLFESKSRGKDQISVAGMREMQHAAA